MNDDHEPCEEISFEKIIAQVKGMLRSWCNCSCNEEHF